MFCKVLEYSVPTIALLKLVLINIQMLWFRAFSCSWSTKSDCSNYPACCSYFALSLLIAHYTHSTKRPHGPQGTTSTCMLYEDRIIDAGMKAIFALIAESRDGRSCVLSRSTGVYVGYGAQCMIQTWDVKNDSKRSISDVRIHLYSILYCFVFYHTNTIAHPCL